MKTTTNTWTPVKDYEDWYEINPNGSVRSKREQNFGYIMIQRIDRGGYYTIRLAKPGMKSCTFYVHRLLGFAYIENPLDKPQINHLDGDKLNNHIDNLEWVDRSENMIHAYAIGLASTYNCREIVDDRTGQIFFSLREAAEYNFYTYSTFKNYMNGKRNNQTSLRYRDDGGPSIATLVPFINAANLFNPTTVARVNMDMLISPNNSVNYNGVNSFPTPFNRSAWRLISLVA